MKVEDVIGNIATFETEYSKIIDDMDELIIEEARQLFKEKKIEDAIALLKGRLEMKGDDEMCLMELGIIYNGIADFPQALNCFNAVLCLNSGHVKARTYINIINNILNYYCKDLLNP